MDFRISYAQNREDIFIAAFFPDVETGHYVDVGAGHPEELSVTKVLYDRGWSGINVEPIPELVEALRTERPRDVTVQLALAATAGEAMLADVLAEHPLDHVHVLKVDVEGAEYDVLKGVDWNTFVPDLVCIETDRVRTDWSQVLREAGYEQVFHDGLNAYLLAPEARHRAEYFNYADVVLNGPTIVTSAEARELTAAAQLRTQVAAAKREAEHLRLAVAERDLRIADLDGTVVDLTNAVTAENDLRAIYAERHAAVTARLATAEATLAEVLGSKSWRVTYPLRRFMEILGARLPRRLLVLLWHRFRRPGRAVGTDHEFMMSPGGTEVLARMKELE